MGFLERADESAFVWLNSWVGRFSLLDRIVELTVSDYFVPLIMSLLLLGLWFAGHSSAHREPNQLGVMTAILSVAVVNLIVELFNEFFYRPRPFEDLDVDLLFYMPTDSSFPANPAAFGFALALGVWMWNRKAGWVLLAPAVVFSLSRMYAGVFYPLDVIGGAAVGAASALFCGCLMRIFKRIPLQVLRLARAVYLA